MLSYIVGTIAFVAWLIIYWNLQLRLKFFAQHYFLSVIALVISAFFAASLGYFWIKYSLLGVLIGACLFFLSVLFIVLAGLQVQVFMETRFLRLGKLFRNLTWHQEVPVVFSVLGDVEGDAWGQPKRKIEAFEVITQDSIRIRGTHISAGHSSVVVIAHGSFRSKNTAAYVFLAQWLAYKYDVLAFDFRGHGESDGNFDMSDAPVFDLKAVVDYAKSRGYKKVGVFGRSLGGWIALYEAAKYKDVDSVIVAAAPLAQITDIDTARSVIRIQRVPILGGILSLLAKWAVAVLRGTRFSGFSSASFDPIAIVDRIAPIPIFFIYQEFDWVIKTNVQDAVKIFNAAKSPKELLILAGPGHIFEVHQFHRLYSAIESWFDKTLQ